MGPRAAAAASRESPSTRDSILDAAERCFAERGFSGVSMREMAAAAGLRNQASLYHHFRDKRALYEAVLARGVGPLVALVAASGERRPAGTIPLASAAVVDATLDRVLDYLAAHPHLPRLIQRAGLDDARHLRPTLARFLRPLYAQGLETLGAETRWEAGDLPHVAVGIYHLLFGYFASAALLEVVGLPAPRSAAALARQRRFLKTAVARLLGLTPARRR